MSLPKTILDIIKVIHEKLEIISEKNELISIAIWDFSDNGKISKTYIRNGLRRLTEDEKLFQLEDEASLYLQGWIPGEEIKIRINRKRFKEFYKKYFQEIKPPTGKIKFSDEEAVLKLGDKKCALPPYRSGHYFCRVAFEYPAGEVIDWSVITEKMDMLRQDTKGAERSKRSLYDTLTAEKKRWEQVFNKTSQRVDRWLDKADEIFDFARDAKLKFENGEPDNKKEILSRLGSNLLLKDKTIIINTQNTNPHPGASNRR